MERCLGRAATSTVQGGKVVDREDDNIETVRNRLQAYE